MKEVNYSIFRADAVRRYARRAQALSRRVSFLRLSSWVCATLRFLDFCEGFSLRTLPSLQPTYGRAYSPIRLFRFDVLLRRHVFD